MTPDVFGNLEKWDCVLERLGEFARSGEMERHQDALVRLLRYPDNWRLREAALEAASSICQPSASLVRQLCRLAMDEGLYYQARVLATEALGAALGRQHHSGEELALREEVRGQMLGLLAGHGAPVLHQAVRRILPAPR